MSTIKWPDLRFGPVNLWTVMPADMFYAKPEEQYRIVWSGHKSNRVAISRLPTRANDQLLRNILSLTVCR